MMSRRKFDRVSLHSLILHTAALLVPRSLRADWLAEWKSELWYVLQYSSEPTPNKWWNRAALFFCLGSLKDAGWLRRNTDGSAPRKYLSLQSPLHCLLLLATISAVGICCFFRSTGPYEAIVRNAADRPIIFPQLALMAFALLGLRAVTSFALGEYPIAPRSPARSKRFQRWIFLAIKFALMASIVFCGSLNLTPIISATGLQPHITLVAYVLAFRWALIDQRGRCPVCLRTLTNPATIGQPAQILTGWYGTEYFCEKGHGLMYVPEITTTYSTQRWLDLDSSWANLFS